MSDDVKAPFLGETAPPPPPQPVRAAPDGDDRRFQSGDVVPLRPGDTREDRDPVQGAMFEGEAPADHQSKRGGPGGPGGPSGPGGGGDMFESSTEASPEHIKALIKRLVESDVHPVLMFGTAQSGKTMLLQSLIAFAHDRGKGRLSAQLGDPLFPNGYPSASKRNSVGQFFFNMGLARFRDLNAANPTLADPYLIPIDVSIDVDDGVKRVLKFAFFEMRGELFGRKPDDPAVYRPLPPEVDGVIRLFPQGVSAVFVAPSELSTGEMKESYEHLSHAMNQYERFRSDYIHNDNQLFVASKWDAITNTQDVKGNFTSADAKTAANIIQNFAPAWPTFSSMIGPREKAKSMMPYASSLWSGKHMKEPGHLQPVLDHYNKTLWNWLVANADQVREQKIAARTGKSQSVPVSRTVLFDEVVPKPVKRKRRPLIAWLLFLPFR